MAAPIVYRWDDGNAPVARGEKRSMCDILHACLVTGYGDKPGAGWTREYVNATFDKAVFRNNPITGTGFYVQVNGTHPYGEYYFYIVGYELMTDVDTGINPFMADNYVPFGSTSNVGGTAARPWILIADDRAFYFFCWTTIAATTPLTTSTVVAGGIFFGDIIPRLPDDAYACALIAARYSYHSLGIVLASSAHPGSVPYSSTNFAVARKESGVAGAIIVNNVLGGGPSSGPYAGSVGIPYVPGGPIYLARPHVNDGNPDTFRGFLPGYYYPCHPNAFGQLETYQSDGKTFLSIRHTVANNAEVNTFISLDDWRA